MTFDIGILLTQLGAILFTFLLFWLIKLIFKGGKMQFTDFIKGDDGGYSLSRLQAVAWAVVIISLQISTIICVLLNSDAAFNEYKVVFAKNTLILLGLSLGSYVAVKGITVSKMTGGTQLQVNKPDWSDIITGNNGLDFSKFQMLVWTLIAILDFFAVSHNYLYHLREASKLSVSMFFNTDATDPAYFLPTVDGTFLVLMGISQGAYIGKKLIPSDQAEATRSDRTIYLTTEIDKLKLQIDDKSQEQKNLETTNSTAPDQLKALLQVKLDLIDFKAKLAMLQNELTSISDKGPDKPATGDAGKQGQ